MSKSNDDSSTTTTEKSERLFDQLVKKGAIEVSGDLMRSVWFGTGEWVSRFYVWDRNQKRRGYRENHFAEIVRQKMQSLFRS